MSEIMVSFDFSTLVDRHNTYCTQWDYVQDRFGKADLLPFTISDMDFETAPCVLSAIRQRMDHGILGYSRWNHDDFKKAVTGWFTKRYDCQLDEQSVVYGPSVVYIIAQLITQWTEPNEGILVHTPAYDAFANVIEGNHRQCITSPLLKIGGSYQIDWPQFEAQASLPHCKVMLLCSPHNPTGRVWSEDELVRTAQICKRHNVKVISDDIHMDMAYLCYMPWAKVAVDDQWALISSGSKSFNIPALTGAYAFIPNAEVREQFLTTLKEAHGLSSPSILGVIAHISAYRDGDEWLDTLKAYLLANLRFVADEINCAFPEVNYHVPEGTYLAWLDLSPLNINMDQLQKRLIEQYKVAVMRGDTYGKEGEGYLRFNVGCPRSKVEAGLKAIISAIRDLQVE